MEENDDEYPLQPEETPLNLRKRKRNLTQWKCAVDQMAKREARNQGCVIACNHRNTHFCEVRTIDKRILLNFHKSFWRLGNSVAERTFLQKCLTIKKLCHEKFQHRILYTN